MREHFETVVLDSQGMSTWLAQDRKMLAMMQAFHGMGTDVVINANTIVEISHRRMNVPRLNWALSRIKVDAVTADLAKEAATLLKEVGLHGHKYAIDATVAQTALRQPGPVALITSDLDDMSRLCGDRIRVISV